ncbi:MAG: cardiolipin synthase [bacterium]|nr:cardiolipin synthase [bacterium]
MEEWKHLFGVWEWMTQNFIAINMIVSIFIVFFQRRDPKTVWAWLLCLNFIPIFGVFFYLIFGQDFRKQKMFHVKEVEDSLNRSVRSQERIIRRYSQELMEEEPLFRDYRDLIYYNLETGGSVMTMENQVMVFSDGEKKFESLRRDLREARQYIHFQYYIIKNDEVFASILPILKEKVEEGVEVRILYDGMGGRFMPHRQWKEIQNAGIQCGEFFPPVLGRLNFRINYRNHRKIVVIDGKLAYVGGFNVGKEYVSKDVKFGYWRDTHLRILGQAALGLQIRFALDWNYATKENLFLNAKYFQEAAGLELERNIGIQIIDSGPDTKNRQIRDNYLQLMHKARHHIYIHTPYFVPDDAVLSALVIAAQSGIDVRLMIPCKPDHPFVYWATYSYMGDLLEAGGRCYTYENGFLHAKGVMADGMVSCYGTANMDIRSFELNFEVNAVIYNEEITGILEEEFLKDIEHCHEVTKEEYENRSLWLRIKEQSCRLLSPLL